MQDAATQICLDLLVWVDLFDTICMVNWLAQAVVLQKKSYQSIRLLFISSSILLIPSTAISQNTKIHDKLLNTSEEQKIDLETVQQCIVKCSNCFHVRYEHRLIKKQREKKPSHFVLLLLRPQFHIPIIPFIVG